MKGRNKEIKKERNIDNTINQKRKKKEPRQRNLVLVLWHSSMLL